MDVCCQISFLKTWPTQNFDFLFLFGWILTFSFFYNFSKFCLFWTRTSQGRPWFKCKSKIFTKSGTSQGRPWLKFHRIFQVGKKSFFLKNIFFFVFYGCLSFFNGKYRYFATFDQQILAEKLIFRILQHRFSRGSAISKMIVYCLRVSDIISKRTFAINHPNWGRPAYSVSLRMDFLDKVSFRNNFARKKFFDG